MYLTRNGEILGYLLINLTEFEMEIKIKLLNDKRYKSGDTFDAAIERWQEKDWNLAEVAQDIPAHGDDAVAILWRPK
jgi:hypothetical protein